MNLRDALKEYESERFYNNGRIPEYVRVLAAAAVGNTPKPTLRDVFPNEDLWEIEETIEGGQPNGIGEIEERYSRDWFRDEWESHHRLVYTVRGPWEEGPTAQEAERRRKHAEHQARLAEEREANRPTEEDKILAKADEIRARRAREVNPIER